MSDDITTWRTGPSRGGFAGRNVKVYSPGCPATPHAERNCRCRTFRDGWNAQQYINEQIALDNSED